MSQISLREYDAKILFSKSQDIAYHGIFINDIEQLDYLIDDWKRYVVKPDQLFGKRWKLDLIWLNLTIPEVKSQIISHFNESIEINWVTWVLDSFLIEPFVPHDIEYFLSFTTERDWDTITFSNEWWINIEDSWGHTKSFSIWVLDCITTEIISSSFGITDSWITEYIYTMFTFFRTYWFTYLEINPFVVSQEGAISHLDMVAKVDSCEWAKQKNHWGNISFSLPFWKKRSFAEEQITELDKQTWASLKFSMLHTDWSIWLVLWGWGASVITMDTLASYDMLAKVGNYGELSWNPTLEDNLIYTRIVIEQMLKSKSTKKVLCIIGGIANFTRIDTMVQWIIWAIDTYQKEFKEQWINIIVRRWWINDIQALSAFTEYCTKVQIPFTIADSTIFLTKPLEQLVWLL